jgi:hypothetical protein
MEEHIISAMKIYGYSFAILSNSLVIEFITTIPLSVNYIYYQLLTTEWPLWFLTKYWMESF